MPNVGDITRDVTVQSFQSLNGDNQTIAMVGLNYQAGKKVSLFAGGGYDTNFKDNLGLPFDVKGKYQFDENHSIQARIRSLHSDKKNTTQFRISPGWQEQLGKNTSIYLNPYYAYKIDYNNNKHDHSIGAFGGISQKIGNTTISLEGQRYNLQVPEDNSGKNWSINLIISYKF